MSPYTISFLILFVVSVLIVWWVLRWLLPALQALLQDVVGASAIAEYYRRVFVLAVVLMVLAAVADPSFNFKDTVHPIEHVWAVTHGLKSVFENLTLAMLVYLGLLTVVVAALRRRS